MASTAPWLRKISRDRRAGHRSAPPSPWNRYRAPGGASLAARRRAHWGARGSPGIPGRREPSLLAFLVIAAGCAAVAGIDTNHGFWRFYAGRRGMKSALSFGF